MMETNLDPEQIHRLVENMNKGEYSNILMTLNHDPEYLSKLYIYICKYSSEKLHVIYAFNSMTDIIKYHGCIFSPDALNSHINYLTNLLRTFGLEFQQLPEVINPLCKALAIGFRIQIEKNPLIKLSICEISETKFYYIILLVLINITNFFEEGIPYLSPKENLDIKNGVIINQLPSYIHFAAIVLNSQPNLLSSAIDLIHSCFMLCRTSETQFQYQFPCTQEYFEFFCNSSFFGHIFNQLKLDAPLKTRVQIIEILTAMLSSNGTIFKFSNPSVNCHPLFLMDVFKMLQVIFQNGFPINGLEHSLCNLFRSLIDSLSSYIDIFCSQDESQSFIENLFQFSIALLNQPENIISEVLTIWTPFARNWLKKGISEKIQGSINFIFNVFFNNYLASIDQNFISSLLDGLSIPVPSFWILMRSNYFENCQQIEAKLREFSVIDNPIDLIKTAFLFKLIANYFDKSNMCSVSFKGDEEGKKHLISAGLQAIIESEKTLQAILQNQPLYLVILENSVLTFINNIIPSIFHFRVIGSTSKVSTGQSIGEFSGASTIILNRLLFDLMNIPSLLSTPDNEQFKVYDTVVLLFSVLNMLIKNKSARTDIAQSTLYQRIITGKILITGGIESSKVHMHLSRLIVSSLQSMPDLLAILSEYDQRFLVAESGKYQDTISVLNLFKDLQGLVTGAFANSSINKGFETVVKWAVDNHSSQIIGATSSKQIVILKAVAKLVKYMFPEKLHAKCFGPPSGYGIKLFRLARSLIEQFGLQLSGETENVAELCNIIIQTIQAAFKTKVANFGIMNYYKDDSLPLAVNTFFTLSYNPFFLEILKGDVYTALRCIIILKRILKIDSRILCDTKERLDFVTNIGVICLQYRKINTYEKLGSLTKKIMEYFYHLENQEAFSTLFPLFVETINIWINSNDQTNIFYLTPIVFYTIHAIPDVFQSFIKKLINLYKPAFQIKAGETFTSLTSMIQLHNVSKDALLMFESHVKGKIIFEMKKLSINFESVSSS